MTDPNREEWQIFLSEPDEASFEPLYDKTKALVWTLCRRVLGNEEDARDAFQSAWLRLFAEIRAENFPEDQLTQPNQYLIRLTVREADNLRTRRHRLSKREVVMDPLPTHIAKNTAADHLAAQEQVRLQLEALMRLLPEIYRLPLQLHFFDGLSQTQIAEILEVNDGTISRRIAKGLKKLDPLVRRAGLRDALTALTAMALTGALLQPPAAFSAAVIFTQIQTALAAGVVASGIAVSSGGAGMSFASKSAAALKQTLWTAVTMKPVAAITSAAFIVGVGAVLTLGSIRKSHSPAPPPETPPVIASAIPASADFTALPKSVANATPDEQLYGRIFKIKNASTDEIADRLKEIKSKAGEIQIDSINRTISVKDTFEKIKMMEELIKILDRDPKTGNSDQGMASQNTGDRSQKRGMLGPWRLALGNPIMLKMCMISVLGADNPDGIMELILITNEAMGRPNVQFLAYDSVGNAHNFIEVTSSTSQWSRNRPQITAPAAGRPSMLVYQLAETPPAGTQITSIAITGDVQELLKPAVPAIPAKAPIDEPKEITNITVDAQGESRVLTTSSDGVNQISAARDSSAASADSGNEQRVILGPHRLADGSLIMDMGPVVADRPVYGYYTCVIGAERTDSNVELAYHYPAQAREDLNRLDLKFVGYDDRGGTHDFVQMTSTTSQHDGEPGDFNLNVYQLETPVKTGFRILSVAITANAMQYKRLAENVDSLPELGRGSQQKVVFLRYANAENLASTLLRTLGVGKSGDEIVCKVRRAEERQFRNARFRILRVDDNDPRDRNDDSVEIMINLPGHEPQNQTIKELASVTVDIYEITAEDVLPGSGNPGDGSVRLRIRDVSHDIEAGISIKPNAEVNALIINYSKPELYQKAEGLIRQLDQPKKQISMEAAFIPLPESAGEEFLAKWGIASFSGGELTTDQIKELKTASLTKFVNGPQVMAIDGEEFEFRIETVNDADFVGMIVKGKASITDENMVLLQELSVEWIPKNEKMKKKFATSNVRIARDKTIIPDTFKTNGETFLLAMSAGAED